MMDDENETEKAWSAYREQRTLYFEMQRYRNYWKKKSERLECELSSLKRRIRKLLETERTDDEKEHNAVDR